MSWTEGEHYYINKDRLLVFTEKYHLARGYCCGRGCLHCPFHYERVPEPAKSRLLHEKQEKNTEKQ